jgi:mono/diheme cytochrome c family protein
MKKVHYFLAVGVFVFSLTGCGVDPHPAYSPNVKYGVRTDPIVKDEAKLGQEGHVPDRPGVLPLMKFDDIYKPESPMYAARAKIDDTILRDPGALSHKDRRELELALEAQFGTPSRPTLGADVAGIDASIVDELRLDDHTLLEGSKNYRVHCMHCHGVPGDGRGPTARWINPHPRDFRVGMFKFQSIDQATAGVKRPPSRNDLLRTLRHGIEGTAMPSFNLLKDEDLESLVSYVMFLSIRGSTELRILTDYFMANDKALVLNVAAMEEQKIADLIPTITEKLVTKPSNGWKSSNDPSSVIKVSPYPYKEGDLQQLKESVQRGQYIFLGNDKMHERGKKGDCRSCHDDYGRQARFKFDQWGTLVRPNNFPQGVFRGGRRPVDLYYRIHSGINGSGMTPFGNPNTNLKGEDIWDVINFVQMLSQPAMLKKLEINID